MDNYFLSNQKVKIPKIIYGTAWKKDRTAGLVELALLKGFRGIDTACQPKHYNESSVGLGLKLACSKGVDRKEIFLQTKFTPLGGQDPNDIPYDPNETLTNQVLQSFSASLKNLKTDYIDSLVLHSPLGNWDDLMEVWHAMESIVNDGGAKQIGISNCYNLEVLERLNEEVKIKPAVIQNRFYIDSGYDIGLRQFCLDNNIYYQSFWSLTANLHILESDLLKEIAKSKNKTLAQVFFRFLSSMNIIPLTGTTSEQHMEEDLDIFSFELDDDELKKLDRLGPFS